MDYFIGLKEKIKYMVDKNGNKIKKGQLILLKNDHYKNGKYFYIEGISTNTHMIYGKRVNKNLSFNRYDKENNNKKYILIHPKDIMEIIEPLPVEFQESLRKLHFFVDEIMEDFGVLISKKDRYILRAVKYENGSYGIVQNQLLFDYDSIDSNYELIKIFVDLTYDELNEKWNKIKTHRMNIDWIKEFNF